MPQRDGLRLHGGANLSKYGFCKDCKRAIVDQSRSRKKARCDVCSINHIVKIKKLSSDRINRERKELAELNKKKTGTTI